MRKRVSRILAVTLATAVTVTAMPSEAEAAFRSFDSVPKAVSQAISQAASQKEIRYFPVTLYDYDQDTINQAVYQEDKAENPNSRVLRGIYFSNGAPGSSYATWNTWTGLLTTNNTISSTQTSQKGYVTAAWWVLTCRMETFILRFRTAAFLIPVTQKQKEFTRMSDCHLYMKMDIIHLMQVRIQRIFLEQQQVKRI